MPLNYRCYQLQPGLKSRHTLRLNWLRLEFHLKQNG